MKADYFHLDDYDWITAHFDMERRQVERRRAQRFLMSLDWTEQQLGEFHHRVDGINDRCNQWLRRKGHL